VALLNIVMNTTGVELGPELQDFKTSTQMLNTSLRGDRISVNSFIRTIHNSLSRRMDLLNTDLALENQVEATEAAKKKQHASKKSRSLARTKKKRRDEFGFHFIAYVPAAGAVWELDGLRSNPHRLGQETRAAIRECSG
jgi:ubiquitin carboxyl-terminal hydrolase L5